MELKDHLKILQALAIPYKSNLIRILWIILKDHANEIETPEFGGIEALIRKVLVARGEQH